MIQEDVKSIIKRWKFQQERQRFRKKFYCRDKWIVSKFNLPELEKSELQKVNEVWPFIKTDNDDLIWNRLYKMKNGFDPYFVSDYQMQPIYKVLNPAVEVEFLKNKALIDVYCSDIAFPKTHIKCINGQLYDCEGKMINKSDVIKILRATGESDFIIKPSIDSGCGKGVYKFQFMEKELLDAMHNAGKNFIIQECLQQCVFLSTLNDSSINTCRITSFYIDGEFSLFTILKIGKKGAIIDNWNSSYFIGVDAKGRLSNFAYDNKLNEVTTSDSGIKFEGLVYPNYSNLINIIEKYHKKYFPTLGILGWDVFIDNHNEIRVIEVNPDYPGVKGAQFCVGTFFKAYRNAIVSKILNNKNKAI